MGKFKFYTVAETAQVFKRTPRTIRRWISEQYIQKVYCVRDGYLIREDEINRILKDGSRLSRG
jgi:predicted site-specific integrase-resolvase